MLSPTVISNPGLYQAWQITGADRNEKPRLMAGAIGGLSIVSTFIFEHAQYRTKYVNEINAHNVTVDRCSRFVRHCGLRVFPRRTQTCPHRLKRPAESWRELQRKFQNEE
jgi:hypothetical protein